MKLLLLVLAASCTAQPTPNWSGPCMAKNTGPASPMSLVAKNPAFIQDVSESCKEAPMSKEYIHCYNQIVYTFCVKITDAIPCTFTLNATADTLSALCSAKECDNSKDLAATEEYIKNNEDYKNGYVNSVSGSCGTGMGGVGIVVLVLSIVGAAVGGVCWYKKRQDNSGYFTHD